MKRTIVIDDDKPDHSIALFSDVLESSVYESKVFRLFKLRYFDFFNRVLTVFRSFRLRLCDVGYSLLSLLTDRLRSSGYSFARRNSDEIAPMRSSRQVTFCTAKSTTCLTNPANIFGNPKPHFSPNSRGQSRPLVTRRKMLETEYPISTFISV